MVLIHYIRCRKPSELSKKCKCSFQNPSDAHSRNMSEHSPKSSVLLRIQMLVNPEKGPRIINQSIIFILINHKQRYREDINIQ